MPIIIVQKNMAFQSKLAQWLVNNSIRQTDQHDHGVVMLVT